MVETVKGTNGQASDAGEDAVRDYTIDDYGDDRALSHPAPGNAGEAAPGNGEAQATSECPICGEDSPHQHPDSDIEAWIDAQASRFGFRARPYRPDQVPEDLKRLVGEIWCHAQGANTLRWDSDYEGVEYWTAELVSYLCHDCPERMLEPSDELLKIIQRRAIKTTPAALDPVAWPEPKVTNPDMVDPTGVPYLDCLIHRVLDAQQDVNFAANEGMNQSLCNVSELFDEIEAVLRKTALLCHPALDPVTVEACAKIADYQNVYTQGEQQIRDAIARRIRALFHPAPGNAGEAFGWFEPITPTFGGSLVERFAKGPDKPRHFSDFAFRLYAAPASNPQEGGAVSRRASEGDPK